MEEAGGSKRRELKERERVEDGKSAKEGKETGVKEVEEGKNEEKEREKEGDGRQEAEVFELQAVKERDKEVKEGKEGGMEKV